MDFDASSSSAAAAAAAADAAGVDKLCIQPVQMDAETREVVVQSHLP